MKKLLLILMMVLIGLVAFGCGSFGWLQSDQKGTAILTKSNPELYLVNEDGLKGKSSNIHYEGSIKDEIAYDGYQSNGMIKYFKVIYQGKMYYLEEAIDKNDYEIATHPLSFTIPKNKDEETWSRAVSYINQNSDMKIQTQTDLVIETYNPISDEQIGFSVDKHLSGDEYNYNVDCNIKGESYITSPLIEAQKLAYYIKYGKKTDLKNFDFYKSRIKDVRNVE